MLLLPILLAFGGGVVSFVSPCVLPLVPVYLSVVTGFDVATVAAPGRDATPVIVRDTALFVVGFTIVFVLLGTTASVVGRALFVDHLLLTRIAGGVIVAMALMLAGSQLLRAPLVYQERRFHLDARRFGPFAAPLFGAAFGFGWTPCIGPILASVLTVASTSGQAGRGALLLTAYSLGLGVPFLVAGLLLGRLGRAVGWLRRHLRTVTLASAGLMAALGVLLLAGQLSLLDTAAGALR